jgi:hypothetical protein
MRCIVSTSAGVFLVDFDRRRAARLPDRDEGTVYGISWAPGSDELVFAHAVARPPADGREDLAWYATSEQGFLSAGPWRSRRCLSHPHQIACLRDGRIACTNTGRNCLTLLDRRRPHAFEEWQLSPSRWDRTSSSDNSGDHLNSVFGREDELWLLAHRFDRGSCVAVLDARTLEPRSIRQVPWCTGMHNLWVDESGRGFGLASHQSALVSLETGKMAWCAPRSDAFARGLAVTRNRLVVGLSSRADRAGRFDGSASVLLIDRANGRDLVECRLDGLGAIGEVRVLDEPDLAHHEVPLVGEESLWGEAVPHVAEFGELPARSLAGDPSVLALGGFRGVPVGIAPRPNPPDGSGWLRADRLALLVLETEPPDEVAFEYDLSASDGGHASLAIGMGPGAVADSDMTLLMVQRNGDAAFASVWTRGLSPEDWTRVAVLEGLRPPIRGRIRARRDRRVGWRLDISGAEVSHEATDRAASSGHWGIRWASASIRTTRD